MHQTVENMEIVSISMQLFLQELQRSPLSIFLLLLFLLFTFKFFKPGLKLKLPPSPPKLPIIGNLHQLGKFPHVSFRALSEKYGPLLLFQLGFSRTLVVSSADMVKEMMESQDIVFSNRPTSTAADVFFYGGKDSAFAPYSEYWRQTRKICVLQLLSMKKVISFEYVRKEETEELVRNIRNASLSGETVNLTDMVVATLNNIIFRCVLGVTFREDVMKKRFGELARRMSTQFAAFSFGNYFPYLRWVDVVTGLTGSLKESFNELDSFLERVIEEHKKAAESMMSSMDDQQSHDKDFVDILLQLQKDDKLDVELTQENIKAILVDMFVAGSDASSTVVEWAMAELLNRPSAMKKVQEEVRRVVGNNNHKSRIEVNDIDQMGYFKCIIKETLRLHPPAVLIPRATSKNITSVKLGGYDIPPDTNVHINAWAIQRDPKLWDRPEEFLPQRFENNHPVEFRGQDFHLLPFGGGRRGCPGLTFGLFGIEYMLSNLLYWFDWKLPENGANSGDMDMTEAFAIAVHKKIPVTVLPIPYNPRS